MVLFMLIYLEWPGEYSQIWVLDPYIIQMRAPLKKTSYSIHIDTLPKPGEWLHLFGPPVKELR